MQHLLSRKRKASRKRNRQFLRYGIIVIAVLGLSYLYVWQRVYSLKLSEERARRLQRVRLLEEKCRALDYEINELSSMQRIENIAKTRFGLSPLRESQIISYPGYRDRRTLPEAQTASSSTGSGVSISTATAEAGER